MNTHTTAHPDPATCPLVTDTLPNAVTLKFGYELTVIVTEHDPAAAEAWLLDASAKLADLARLVSVRAAIKAAS